MSIYDVAYLVVRIHIVDDSLSDEFLKTVLGNGILLTLFRYLKGGDDLFVMNRRICKQFRVIFEDARGSLCQIGAFQCVKIFSVRTFRSPLDIDGPVGNLYGKCTVVLLLGR